MRRTAIVGRGDLAHKLVEDGRGKTLPILRGNHECSRPADHFAAITHSFVEVAPLAAIERTPELDPQSLNNTNRLRIHVFANDAKAQALLLAVYDNLGKGASGAAVQNLNLMLGIAPGTSL